jgi:hypothetical protein
MRHNDKTQRVKTPACLRKAFQHLQAVALNSAQLVITNIRVNGFEGFEARQLR